MVRDRPGRVRGEAVRSAGGSCVRHDLLQPPGYNPISALMTTLRIGALISTPHDFY